MVALTQKRYFVLADITLIIVIYVYSDIRPPPREQQEVEFVLGGLEQIMLPFNQFYSTESGDAQNLFFESEAQPTTHRHDAQTGYVIGCSCKDISAPCKTQMQMTQLLPSPAPPPRRHYARWWCNIARKALRHCQQLRKSNFSTRAV